MQKYHETISIVLIHELECTGIVESLGAYASKIKYTIDGVEHEDVFDNEDFSILEEITFTHIEDN